MSDDDMPPLDHRFVGWGYDVPAAERCPRCGSDTKELRLVAPSSTPDLARRNLVSLVCLNSWHEDA